MLVATPQSFLFPILLLLRWCQIDGYIEKQTGKQSDRRMCVIYLSSGSPFAMPLPIPMSIVFRYAVPEFSDSFQYLT